MGERAEYLVTGGAGFIGSHLCRHLIAQDHRVFCLDNLQTGSLHNLDSLHRHRNFTFVEHDIIEPINLGLRPNVIVNLACAASPARYQQDPVHTMKTSVLGALNVLELARRSRSVVAQASTSEIYGDPAIHPQPESYCGNVNPIGPRACYDEGKRAAETLFFDYARHHGVRIKIARIFNTYGPHMDPEDGRIVSNFICQALSDKPLTIYGSGRQTRSLCYVDDLVTGLLALAHTPDEITGPVNLGNPNELAVIDIAKLIVELTNSNSKMVFKPLPPDDPQRRRPVIDLAGTLLGWRPRVPVREGLARTIHAFRERQGAVHTTPPLMEPRRARLALGAG